ncbi:Protein RoBo-1 [Fukomys damarensis]|uniref:Protein RoBo-1 n=1 Tax=Fukomys damarensis TaxID=885580 RepID=A0A091E5K2_FUKDA|nr:Protein RoBo-1 [Fukomys damarensis]
MKHEEELPDSLAFLEMPGFCEAKVYTVGEAFRNEETVQIFGYALEVTRTVHFLPRPRIVGTYGSDAGFLPDHWSPRYKAATETQQSGEESYECISCSGGQCRSNPTATCTTSQGCFSLQQELNISGQQILLAQDKGCSSGACSALAFSVTLGEKRAFRYDRRCCDGQRCNKENVTLSLKSSKPNGIECPACYNATGLSCTPVQLQCTGEETKCIEVVGTVTVNRIPYFALFGMGCATASACQLDLSVLNGTSVRSYCAGPNSGSPPLMSIISAILPGLFLLKVLL